MTNSRKFTWKKSYLCLTRGLKMVNIKINDYDLIMK